MTGISQTDAARALLRWYAEMGVDEAVGSAPASWFAEAQTLPPSARPSEPAPAATSVFKPTGAFPAADDAVRMAEEAARACADFQALGAAVAGFAACPLKAGARNTVFADGVPGAALLVIGEAPGRDEDRLGKPFVGRAGQLLDRMLAAIGRSRQTDTLISNVVYWRPPGNRTPTQLEIATCKPFVDRLIELTNPKAIVLAGGAALQALTGAAGIMRARGKWRDIETASGARFAALPILHPAFLLRQPSEKRLAWSDLQILADRLRDG